MMRGVIVLRLAAGLRRHGDDDKAAVRTFGAREGDDRGATWLRHTGSIAHQERC